MKTFIIENIETILVSILGGGGFLGWFFERRKRNLQNEETAADVESKEIDNGEKIIKMYQDALLDLENRCSKLKGRYETQFNEFTALYEKKIKLLKEEILVQKRINKNLRRENADLRKRIKELET